MDTRFADSAGANGAQDLGHEDRGWRLPATYRGEASDAVSTLGEIARELGITAREVRFYEDGGLLPRRRAVGALTYGPRERLYLEMILKGKELGLTLPEIRDILTARAAEADAPHCESHALAAADLSALGMQPGRGGSLDAMKLDLAEALRPEQILAQIDHLERQREALDDAILALCEAHRRRVARDVGSPSMGDAAVTKQPQRTAKMR
jgi:DNA-binding transcriptional MerR regulator